MHTCGNSRRWLNLALSLLLAWSGLASSCNERSTFPMDLASLPETSVSTTDLVVFADTKADLVSELSPRDVSDSTTTTQDYSPAAGQFGWPCLDNSECFSGWCVENRDGHVCTTLCNEECPKGYACAQVAGSTPDALFICLPLYPNLCRPCIHNSDCAGNQAQTDDRCIIIEEDGAFCGGQCGPELPCPDGYQCQQTPDIEGKEFQQCVPTTNTCECTQKFVNEKAQGLCWKSNDNGACMGWRRCTTAGLTKCNALEPSSESCDGVDNNCDGATDEEIEPQLCQVQNQYGTCEGMQACTLDGPSCDAVVPTPDVCDGKDNNCDGETDQGYPDTDEDAVADCIDDDDDGDGTLDEADNCPLVANAQQLDADQDGKGDECDANDDDDNYLDKYDNCPAEPNDQTDTDGDGQGDTCDLDDDNDGIPDLDDNCHLTWNPDQLDTDLNKKGDACEADMDGDGVLDNDDNCKLTPNPSQVNSDDDGYGNKCDWDDDNDGDLDETDCEPLSAAVFHGAEEKCNLVDDNCDGETDEENATGCKKYLYDGDGDGFGLLPPKCLCSTKPKFKHTAEWLNDSITDCDDNNPAVNPNVQEVCNTKDDDCDGVADEEDSVGCLPYFFDGDEDGYGISTQDHPMRCLCGQSGQYTVLDALDCDDEDYLVYPGAEEKCNEKDDDCDGTTDEERVGDCEAYFQYGYLSYFYDWDNDQFANQLVPPKCLCGPTGLYTANDPNQGQEPIPCGYNKPDGSEQTGTGFDCDDTHPLINPCQLEVCNGVDDDCNGKADEEGSQTGGGAPALLNCITYFMDEDGDGYGCKVIQGTQECEKKDANGDIVKPSQRCLCNPEGTYTAFNAQDCDDGAAEIHPGAQEACNSVDDNCDGWVDEDFPDMDGDWACCGANNDVEDSPPLTQEGAQEQCDDETCGADCVDIDADGDGFVAKTNNGQDCNDGDAQVHPLAQEICDGKDNDCDGKTDELGKKIDFSICEIDYGYEKLFADKDADGYGVQEDWECLCAPKFPYVPTLTSQFPNNPDMRDCLDTDATVNPAMTEACNGKDDDCDAVVDEGFSDVDGDWPCCHDNDAHVDPAILNALSPKQWDQCNEGQCGADCADPDGDGDGYAPPADCCDIDANAHPGQTSYFSEPSACAEIPGKLPFDYDCNGAEQKHWNTQGKCVGWCGWTGCCTEDGDWSADGDCPGIPQCGEKGCTHNGCVWAGCYDNKGYFDRTQECR